MPCPTACLTAVVSNISAKQGKLSHFVASEKFRSVHCIKPIYFLHSSAELRKIPKLVQMPIWVFHVKGSHTSVVLDGICVKHVDVEPSICGGSGRLSVVRIRF